MARGKGPGPTSKGGGAKGGRKGRGGAKGGRRCSGGSGADSDGDGSWPKGHRSFEVALAEARRRGNIKLYNGLMARHAKFGQIETVRRTLDDMRASGLAPNEFSYSILLNALIRSGNLDRSDDVLADMRRDGVPVNEVTITTLIKGHVAALDMTSAWEHFDQMAEQGHTPNIRTVNTMLRGCLYVGDTAAIRRLTQLVADHGLEPTQATRDTVVRAVCQEFDSKALRTALAAHAPDGLATLSPNALVDAGISFALCGKFKKAAEALRAVESVTAASAKGDVEAGTMALTASLQSALGFLEHPRRAEVAKGFSKDAVRRFPPVQAAQPQGALVWSAPDIAGAAASPAAPLFRTSRPVRLEVGAGLGDWVVDRAEKEPDHNWAAIELRCDRACLIHAKGAMKALDNLSVLAGGANGILRCMPCRSVADVFVNFPQPPQWEGSSDHLVNTAFLAEAWRVVRPGGVLTVTTDNERYVMSIVEQLGNDELKARWQPAFPAPHFEVHADGLHSHASAFDQLWAAKGFVTRYQCKYTAKRGSRAQSGAEEAGRAATVSTAQAAPKKRRRKETPEKRNKRRARDSLGQDAKHDGGAGVAT